MTISDFIDKAIAGGWNHRIQNATIQRVDADDHRFHVHFWDNEGNQSDMFSYSFHALLLDPLAWQAVGKVEGWSRDFCIGQEVAIKPTDLVGRITSIDPTDVRVQVDGVGLQKVPREVVRGREWKTAMHRMIDALAEGKTIEEFLKTL